MDGWTRIQGGPASRRRAGGRSHFAWLALGAGLFCIPAYAARSTEEPPCPEDAPVVPIGDGECRCQDLAPPPKKTTLAPKPKPKPKPKTSIAKKKTEPLKPKASAVKPKRKPKLAPKKKVAASTFPCPPPLAAKAPDRAPPPQSAPPKVAVAPRPAPPAVFPPRAPTVFPPPPVALPPPAVLSQPRIPPPVEYEAVADDVAVLPKDRRQPWSWMSYGELHWPNYDDRTNNEYINNAHIHRVVGGLGYDFSPKLRFRTELELEQAWDAEVGNDDAHLHFEQAYLEADLPARHRVQAGIVLTPVGILNERHDPVTFYGVERNPIEGEIIPTTWFEPGAVLSAELAGGLGYDVAVQSGLRTPGDGEPNAYRPRNGLQQNSHADLSSAAYTGRLRYTLMPGTQIAVAGHYQSDIRQGLDPDAVPATLWVANIESSVGPLSMRSLIARWDIDSPLAQGRRRDVQRGWYTELGYLVHPEVGVFGRYNNWDAGGRRASDRELWSVGANWWPDRRLVFKIEGKLQDGSRDANGVLLGFGYSLP